MLALITLEDHYLSTILGEKLAPRYAGFPPAISERLKDLSTLRLKEMDAGHVSLQIISHAPADTDAASCAAANDELAAAVSAHPSRFAGFALLPMNDPPAAAAELARTVKEHNFVGALLDNHLDSGEYYDDARFWPVFAKAQDLDVPLYIHPTFPTDDMKAALYRGNYGKAAEVSLGMAGWGWHADTALHVLRLFAAGVFDRFPRLKVVIGHMGEMLPYQLERVIKMSKTWGERERGLQSVWDQNVWVTTSGMFSVNPMACMLRNTKVERILYSVDWPFSKNEDGVGFIEELRKSGLVSEEELEGIAYKNAERLLKVKARS